MYRPPAAGAAGRVAGTVHHWTVGTAPDEADDLVVLYIGPDEIPGSDDHEGYVSGRTRGGGDTGIWTDVRAGQDYTAFRAACECGWRDVDVHAPDPDGYRGALDSFVHRHFAPVNGHEGLDPARDFLLPWCTPARS